MRSLWSDVWAVCDASELRIWAGEVARGGGGEPTFIAAHNGSPEGVLAAWLESAARQRWSVQNRLHMTLSYPWTHSLIVPWQDGLFSASAWEAYAQALFAARAVRGSLHVRIEDSGFRKSRLAVAISSDLVGILKETCSAAGWRLASCRDAFSLALQGHAVQLGDNACRFVLLQKNVLTCAFRRDGEWVESITLSRHPAQRLDDLLEAAALMTMQATSDVVYVSASEHSKEVAGAENVIWLDSLTTSWNKLNTSKDTA